MVWAPMYSIHSYYITGWNVAIEAMHTFNLMLTQLLVGPSSINDEREKEEAAAMEVATIAYELIDCGLLDIIVRLLQDVQERYEEVSMPCFQAIHVCFVY